MGVAFDVDDAAEAAASETRADSGTATHAHSRRPRTVHHPHHPHPLLSVRYEPAPWQEPWPPPLRQPRPHLDAMSVATEEEEKDSKSQARTAQAEAAGASAGAAGTTQNLLRQHAGRTWSAGGGNGRWRGGGGHPHAGTSSSSPPRADMPGRRVGTAPSHQGDGVFEASRARKVSFAPSAQHTGALFKKGGGTHAAPAQPQPFVMCYEQGKLSRRR